MIKAVLFDVDGVLLDSFSVNIKWFKHVLDQFNIIIEEEDIRKIQYMSFKKQIELFVPPEKHEAVFEYGLKAYDDFEKDIKIFPHAVEVMSDLSSNYKIGVVTSRVRTDVLQRLGFPELDVSITADDINEPKPDPESLLLACDHLGIKPEEVVYVGDMEVDVLASRACGATSILYNGTSYTEPDYKISDLREIKRIVQKLK
jgi:pyrophosphatase PpaX